MGPSGGPAVCRSLLVTLLPVNMAVNGLWGTFFCYPTNMPFWLFWALFGSLEPLRAPESSQELSGASGSFRLLRASYSPLEPLRAPERAGAQFVPDQFVYTPSVPTHNWSTPFLSQHPIGQHPFCPSTRKRVSTNWVLGQKGCWDKKGAGTN